MPLHPGALSFGITAIASLTSFKVRSFVNSLFVSLETRAGVLAQETSWASEVPGALASELDLRQPNFLLEFSDSGSLHLLLFPRDSAIALENSSCGCLQLGKPLRVLVGCGLGASPSVEEGCPARFLFQDGYVEIGGSRGRGAGAPPNGQYEGRVIRDLLD
ncbi:unnamed protein product [Sphagnum troendelagicum]|uniref:Uncharacterized protein n=1 Tax=Sphagnum troendelagicum TaxID=128251 RepID=A0ABP0U3E9_9BRYO